MRLHLKESESAREIYQLKEQIVMRMLRTWDGICRYGRVFFFSYHKVSVGEPEQGNERISCLNEGKRNKKRWFVALKGNNKRKRNIWKSPCTHTHLKKYLYCTTQTHTHEHHGNGRNKNIVREREREIQSWRITNTQW